METLWESGSTFARLEEWGKMSLSSSPFHPAFDSSKLEVYMYFVTLLSFAFGCDGVGGEENPMEP